MYKYYVIYSGDAINSDDCIWFSAGVYYDIIIIDKKNYNESCDKNITIELVIIDEVMSRL